MGNGLESIKEIKMMAFEPWSIICEYAYKGCQGAQNGELFYEICVDKGEKCSIKIVLEGSRIKNKIFYNGKQKTTEN